MDLSSSAHDHQTIHLTYPKLLFCLNPFDKQILSKDAFAGYENELLRPGLIATGTMGFPPEHIIPQKAVEWIQNNDVMLRDMNIPGVDKKIAWYSVGPGLLTRVVQENKLEKDKPAAMFCTGGIRCEKTLVYLKKKGFKNIYQLNGGILNYLKKIKKKDSMWTGECFVFDNRISLKHGLKAGSYYICSGCRKPINSKDKKSKKYEEGVSCPNCHDNLTEIQKERFRMRQKQINLAKKTGSKHIFQKEFK